jgi:dTDP-4-amino-4,6-dideoxy-D-galactose acyltransferase
MIGQRMSLAQADTSVRAVASDVCSYLEWDSAFFDKRIARANCARLDDSNVSELLDWCGHHRIDCLYFLADTGDAETVRIAQRNDFREVDVRLTLDRPINQQDRFPAPTLDSRVRLARDSDLTVLRQLTRTLHRDSRFYYDEHFDRDKCGLLYAAWIEKSVGDPTQTVFVPEVDSQPVGYISCATRGPETQIGLLGVAPAFAGQGFGKALVQQFITWSALQGSRRGTVVTQERNIAAQGLYRHCGFRPASFQRWYHRWFTND